MRFTFFGDAGSSTIVPVFSIRHFQSSSRARGFPLLREDLLGHEAGVDGKPAVVEDAPELFYLARELGPRRELETHELEHLPVAVLLDEVDALVASDEGREVRVERKRPEAKVARLQVGLLTELIARLLDCPVGGAVGDDAHLHALTLACDDRRG